MAPARGADWVQGFSAEGDSGCTQIGKIEGVQVSRKQLGIRHSLCVCGSRNVTRGWDRVPLHSRRSSRAGRHSAPQWSAGQLGGVLSSWRSQPDTRQASGLRAEAAGCPKGDMSMITEEQRQPAASGSRHSAHTTGCSAGSSGWLAGRSGEKPRLRLAGCSVSCGGVPMRCSGGCWAPHPVLPAVDAGEGCLGCCCRPAGAAAMNAAAAALAAATAGGDAAATVAAADADGLRNSRDTLRTRTTEESLSSTPVEGRGTLIRSAGSRRRSSSSLQWALQEGRQAQAPLAAASLTWYASCRSRMV